MMIVRVHGLMVDFVLMIVMIARELATVPQIGVKILVLEIGIGSNCVRRIAVDLVVVRIIAEIVRELATVLILQFGVETLVLEIGKGTGRKYIRRIAVALVVVMIIVEIGRELATGLILQFGVENATVCAEDRAYRTHVHPPRSRALLDDPLAHEEADLKVVHEITRTKSDKGRENVKKCVSTLSVHSFRFFGGIEWRYIKFPRKFRF